MTRVFCEHGTTLILTYLDVSAPIVEVSNKKKRDDEQANEDVVKKAIVGATSNNSTANDAPSDLSKNWFS